MPNQARTQAESGLKMVVGGGGWFVGRDLGVAILGLVKKREGLGNRPNQALPGSKPGLWGVSFVCKYTFLKYMCMG